MASLAFLLIVKGDGSDLPRRGQYRSANDNPSREQELFEKCVARELAGSDPV